MDKEKSLVTSTPVEVTFRDLQHEADLRMQQVRAIHEAIETYKTAHAEVHKQLAQAYTLAREEFKSLIDAAEQRAMDARIAIEESDKAWRIAHQREHGIIHENTALAKAEVDRRLNDMNEFRAQITQERATYLTRELYDREHKNLMDRVVVLEATRHTLVSRDLYDAGLHQLDSILEASKQELKSQITAIEARDSRYSGGLSTALWFVATGLVILALIVGYLSYAHK